LKGAGNIVVWGDSEADFYAWSIERSSYASRVSTVLWAFGFNGLESPLDIGAGEGISSVIGHASEHEARLAGLDDPLTRHFPTVPNGDIKTEINERSAILVWHRRTNGHSA
jgi:hypothetical protein